MVEKTVSGEASAEQIGNWKNQHRDVSEIRVEVSSSETAVCYLRPADRNITAYALSKVMNKQLLEAGEFLLINCFLGGDERMKPNSSAADDRVVIAAAIEAASMVEILAASSKKL